jgi:hypothetical protein
LSAEANVKEDGAEGPGEEGETTAKAHTEANTMLEVKRNGHVPFMREKPRTVAMVDKRSVQFSYLAVGKPQPSVQVEV